MGVADICVLRVFVPMLICPQLGRSPQDVVRHTHMHRNLWDHHPFLPAAWPGSRGCWQLRVGGGAVEEMGAGRAALGPGLPALLSLCGGLAAMTARHLGPECLSSRARGVEVGCIRSLPSLKSQCGFGIPGVGRQHLVPGRREGPGCPAPVCRH